MSEPAKRGFAAMDPAKQKAIASKGGRAAHIKGTAHEFTVEEAREAGRKGGRVVSRNRSLLSKSRTEEAMTQEIPKALNQEPKLHSVH